MTTVGSLCSGYGGLDLAVAQHYDADVVWHFEYEAAPSKVLEARFPGVPNYNDITETDWFDGDPVDILTAGYPCQPFSHAGKRKGSKDERHLWPYIGRAIGYLRPDVVVLENVRGHVSLGLDAVLGDLAALGYDARWGVVRAADAGAPHGRARVFIVATDTRSGPLAGAAVPINGLRIPAERGGVTPADASGQRHGRRQDGPGVGRVDGEDAGEARQRQRARAVAEHRSAAAPAYATSVGWAGRNEPQPNMVNDGPEPAHSGQTWGTYAPAIHRWERVLGRKAPAPTEPGRNGPRLAPRFVEWMMGLPAGWVTDVDGITRNAQLKMLGNGVVPQQALLALSVLDPRMAT